MPADQSKTWICYSKHVPGYAEKYSERNIRKRNAVLLKKLRDAPDPKEDERLRRLLAENNQPLALYVAHGRHPGLPPEHERVRETFQDCCLFMTLFVNRWDRQNDPVFFQRQLYLFILSYIRQKELREAAAVPYVTVPFDETLFLPENDTAAVNTALLRASFSLLPSRRDASVLSDFVFGDEANGIMPEDAERLAEKYYLTRSRIWEIVGKQKRLLAGLIKKRTILGKTDPSDFILTEETDFISI